MIPTSAIRHRIQKKFAVMFELERFLYLLPSHMQDVSLKVHVRQVLIVGVLRRLIRGIAVRWGREQMHHASADPSVILHSDAFSTTRPELSPITPRAEETMLPALGGRALLRHHP